MATKNILTAARLREVLHYDPRTGLFTRIRGGSVKARVGAVVTDESGRCPRIAIGIDRRRYLASRLAWLWMTGKWPKLEIDHINRNSLDNRWTNLRDVTRKQNERNKGRSIANTSGVKHLSFNTRDRLWVVHFSYHKKSDAIAAIKLLLPHYRKVLG